MKFVLVGPGILPIPPPGWGAVEILLWEYFQELTAQGHEAVIVNPLRTSPLDQQPHTSYSRSLIQEINQHYGDVVHIHYDCLHYVIPFLTCPCICISSHYPYIGNTSQYGGYESIFHALCQNDRHFICAISKKDYDIFKVFALHPEKVLYTPNGSSSIPPLDRPGLYLDKSIYVGKVEPRKKQHLYASIPNLDFYGKCQDDFRHLPCYKGEMEHGEMVKLIREYGSLVLLSDGENGGPLVIKEALMAGIPVVTNQYSGMEPMPFIDIIPEERLHDMAYVQDVIEKSRTKDRTGIREYASQYSWKTIVSDYAAMLDRPTVVTSVYQDSYQDVYNFSRKHKLKLIVYEKDGETVHSDITRIGIPNIGRCDYSFLYYIITHYHDLPNKILFTKANYKDQDIQLDLALNTKNFMLIGKHLKYGVFHKDVDTSSLQVHPDDIERLYEPFTDLHFKSNLTIDFYNMIYDKPFLDYVVQFGHGPCFCVSKKLILQHPLSVYERLIDTFQSSHYTWEGHSEEELSYAIGKRYHDGLHRFWLLLFCPHYKNDLIDTDFKNYVSL